MTNYRIVPVEPIERMERAGAAVAHLSAVEAREIYAEMTFSAPDPADDAELVERVARAIYASAHGPREWEAAHTTLHSLYLRDARAALKAIQEGR